MTEKESIKRDLEGILEIQDKLMTLPDLPEIERVKLDQDTALDHLYYSSKLEGTQLTQKKIEKVIHGESSSAR